ncbi:MAG: hypothetical protein ACLR6B_20065 [Blautia sp.]
MCLLSTVIWKILGILERPEAWRCIPAGTHRWRDPRSVIGLVALFKSEVLLSVLPVIIGLIILMDGLVTINQALNLRKLDYRWKYFSYGYRGRCVWLRSWS